MENFFLFLCLLIPFISYAQKTSVQWSENNDQTLVLIEYNYSDGHGHKIPNKEVQDCYNKNLFSKNASGKLEKSKQPIPVNVCLYNAFVTVLNGVKYLHYIYNDTEYYLDMRAVVKSEKRLCDKYDAYTGGTVKQFAVIKAVTKSYVDINKVYDFVSEHFKSVNWDGVVPERERAMPEIKGFHNVVLEEDPYLLKTNDGEKWAVEEGVNGLFSLKLISKTGKTKNVLCDLEKKGPTEVSFPRVQGKKTTRVSEDLGVVYMGSYTRESLQNFTIPKGFRFPTEKELRSFLRVGRSGGDLISIVRDDEISPIWAGIDKVFRFKKAGRGYELYLSDVVGTNDIFGNRLFLVASGENTSAVRETTNKIKKLKTEFNVMMRKPTSVTTDCFNYLHLEIARETFPQLY